MAVQTTPPNGINVMPVFEETTWEHVLAQIEAAKSEGGDSNDALATLILTSLKRSGGGGGGNEAGEKVLKDIKKHKWIAVLLTMIIGPGSMTATYYAIKDRGIANEASVKQLNEKQSEVQPKIEANTKNIGLIKVDVSNIDTSVDQMRLQQTAIADGIESLKQENVNRLQKENDKLERALARERNR